MLDASGGDQPAADARLDELRNPRDPGGERGPPESQRFHDGDGKAFGEARQHESARAADLLHRLRFGEGAEKAYALREPVPGDAALELRPEGALSDERDLDGRATARQPGHRLHEQPLSLRLA